MTFDLKNKCYMFDVKPQHAKEFANWCNKINISRWAVMNGQKRMCCYA